MESSLCPTNLASFAEESTYMVDRIKRPGTIRFYSFG